MNRKVSPKSKRTTGDFGKIGIFSRICSIIPGYPALKNRDRKNAVGRVFLSESVFAMTRENPANLENPA